MPVATSNQFLETLRKSGLVDDALLDETLSTYTGTTEEPTKIAEFLIQRKLITSFQAKSLLAGRFKGLVIGAYRIMEKIGSGGMGIVYMAEHEKLKRRVAIKILPDDKMRDKLSLERFYREARAAAALDHPNIVKAFDVSDHQGMHYLVMEYIDGTNLQKYIDTKGPLPWKTAVNIVIQACKGLQHAHERNMVHRDIKPANILVDKSGQVKILDLGLARSFQISQDNLTQDLSDGQDVMGSIDYIAPEQAIANNAVDVRADIYSLGATVYTLITGKPPVEGTTAQKLLQHQMQMPVPVSRLQPEVPEAVSQIIAKMLAKKPEHRFTTPQEVGQALTPFISTNSQNLPSISAAQFNTQSLIPSSPTTGNLYQPTTGSLQRTAPILGNSRSLSSHSTKIDAKHKTTRVKTPPQKLTLDSKLSPRVLITVGVAAAILIPALTIYFISQSGTKQVARDYPVSVLAKLKGEKETYGSGSKLPDFDVKDMNGKEMKLADTKGKVVLLQFWGYWCQHCAALLPQQRQMFEAYQGRPFVMLGINTDTRADYDENIQSAPVPWQNAANVRPEGSSFAKQFGVKASPTFILIDYRGNIIHIWEGSPPEDLFKKAIEDSVRQAETQTPLPTPTTRTTTPPKQETPPPAGGTKLKAD